MLSSRQKLTLLFSMMSGSCSLGERTCLACLLVGFFRNQSSQSRFRLGIIHCTGSLTYQYSTYYKLMYLPTHNKLTGPKKQIHCTTALFKRVTAEG
jgi:hypothetical protein